MTIRRAPDSERSSFTVIENQTLQDSRLSFDARGLLAFLLSKPMSWHIQPQSLTKESPNAKRDKIYSLLDELEKHGYVVTKQVHGDDGRFIRTERWVYEIAQTETGETVSGEPVDTREERESWQAAGRLCASLHAWIDRNGYKPFTLGAKAQTEMERIIRIDGRTEAEIAVIIEFSQRDDFWLQNIRSPDKLRKHFDTLKVKHERTKPVVNRDDELAKVIRQQKEMERKAAEAKAKRAPMPEELRAKLRGQA